MRIAVVGANGQLGSDVVAEARLAGHEVVEINHADADIVDGAAIRSALHAAAAEAVVNCAAMGHVLGCEHDPLKAFAVNAIGARNVAVAAAESGGRLVHVSTDYVFRGDKGAPYVESDAPGPIHAYGTSKLAGENFVAALQPHHYIVRTSALYGVNRCRTKPQDNFVRIMLKLGDEKGRVDVVADERITPTWTADVAKQILALLDTDDFGIYHATSQGECSWLEFAQAIFDLAGMAVRVEAARTAHDPELRRPAYTVLDNAALRARGIDRMPPWRAALESYLAIIGRSAATA